MGSNSEFGILLPCHRHGCACNAAKDPSVLLPLTDDSVSAIPLVCLYCAAYNPAIFAYAPVRFASPPRKPSLL